MVITPKPVTCYAPPILRSGDGYPLLSWEKEGTEQAGFVKIDLLGNRSLAVIRDTLGNLREEGVFIDERTWQPAEDAETVDALARGGDSMGVFYIESPPAMRQLQKKTGRGDFAHIVIHSSIIRPAANKYINEYVQRLKGKRWEPPLHPPRLAISSMKPMEYFVIRKMSPRQQLPWQDFPKLMQTSFARSSQRKP